ncbi:MAG: hypothetical protein H7323_01500, partial [Frankiales bacterium]|nr:hypothetical protein [Frankiales bacterium]
PASAGPDQILAALKVDPLYVAPASVLRPDEAAVRAALRRTAVPTYLAVVPHAEVDAGRLGIDGLMLELVDGLADRRTVALVGLVATVALGAGLLYARSQRRLRAQAPDDEPRPAGGWTMKT